MSFMVEAQIVSNTRFEQRGNYVSIYYDLLEDADVSIFLSTDGGRTYEEKPIGHVSGAVGKNVLAGKNKSVIWDVLSDRGRLQGNAIRFKVLAEKPHANKTITVGNVSFTMVYVEGGTFSMGCTSEQSGNCYDVETPVHRVTVSDYYIGQAEVTYALIKELGYSHENLKGYDEQLPACLVTYYSVSLFIEELNRRTGLKFRLPTEAEWEYAARGGNKSRGYKYAGSNNIDEVAWYEGNSGGEVHLGMQKKPNELGLYDMCGNLREWCSDFYDENYYRNSPRVNPVGPITGSDRDNAVGFTAEAIGVGEMDSEESEETMDDSDRVMRGGCYDYEAKWCRNASRNYMYPFLRNASSDGYFSYCGFRLVLDAQ